MTSEPDGSKVEPVLRAMTMACPKDPLLMAEIGRTMLRLGMVDEGMTELHHALELGERNFRAGAYKKDGNDINSEPMSKQHSDESRRTRKSRYTSMSRSALLEFAGRQGGDWPGRASILHALGNAYGMSSETDSAITAFRAALAAEPQSPSAAATRFLLARSLAENGEEDQALDELETAVNAGLWVSDQLMQGSAFEDLQDNPRFISIRERMKQNAR